MTLGSSPMSMRWMTWLVLEPKENTGAKRTNSTHARIEPTSVFSTAVGCDQLTHKRRALSKLLLLPRINAVGASNTTKFPRFSLNKKARALIRRRAVSQNGAIRPIFGGETPPQKFDPKKWRQPWRHNRNPVNSLKCVLCVSLHCEISVGLQD
ncbi:hypothetical protein FRACYDRAFT_246215 [Fragilariopsis cylindrus CCMP1102]|uniref:Uncharacterized protein n=1 Tax=Fragilariopsis cylindrus CCMP1102 TaxID=635003 RepID=A0A1E7EYL8_9STRA|nr:hypothetical protein FRACYDRAFT_246215 [Fragilariopsis cylindrus CCMP1102]|eukprot:OEU11110.1 hypothetical protein FRACYDRAFT_246215 [Fragilariopsis cylindrus CCMP1102]